MCRPQFGWGAARVPRPGPRGEPARNRPVAATAGGARPGPVAGALAAVGPGGRAAAVGGPRGREPGADPPAARAGRAGDPADAALDRALAAGRPADRRADDGPAADPARRGRAPDPARLADPAVARRRARTAHAPRLRAAGPGAQPHPAGRHGDRQHLPGPGLAGRALAEPAGRLRPDDHQPGGHGRRVPGRPGPAGDPLGQQAAAEPAEVRVGGRDRQLAGDRPADARPQRRPDPLHGVPRPAADRRLPRPALQDHRRRPPHHRGDGQRRPGEPARPAGGADPAAAGADRPDPRAEPAQAELDQPHHRRRRARAARPDATARRPAGGRRPAARLRGVAGGDPGEQPAAAGGPHRGPPRRGHGDAREGRADPQHRSSAATSATTGRASGRPPA